MAEGMTHLVMITESLVALCVFWIGTGPLSCLR